MADDQVTIDPEFRPPTPDRDQGAPLKTIGVVGVIVAAFAFGWLMRTPEQIEPEPDETYTAATTTSTTGPGEIESSTTTRPSTTSTTAPPVAIDLGVPLSEAVPEFTDIITMERWTETGVDVVRWRSSQSVPETIETFRHDEPSWFAGLDASGAWYALQGENGVLEVQRLDGTDAGDGWGPNLGAVGVRVNSAAWHHSEPGQLAWLTCARAPDGAGTLFRLDAADGLAEPTAVRLLDRVCTDDGGTWLHDWGDWGFALGVSEGSRFEMLLLTADGSETGPVGDGSPDTWLQAASSGGTIWTQEGPNTRRSFILSPDGKTIEPVPGLAETEWFHEARWSADGTHLALSVHSSDDDSPLIRIVEMPSGTTLAEITEPGWDLGLGAWSSDGRFLLYNRWRCQEACGWSEPEEWMLGFYDTTNATSTAIPSSTSPGGGWGGTVRLSNAATPATLVAHYPLDVQTTQAVEDVDGGTIVGATPTRDRFGTPNAAYAFDGEDDRIVIDMRSQLQNDAASIAAWVRINRDAVPRPAEEWWEIVSYGNGGHVLAIQGEGAVLGGLQNTGAECEFVGTDTVFGGDWHHVAFTRDANWTIRVYLDGDIQVTTPNTLDPAGADATADAICPTSPALSPTSVWIGGDLVNARYFDGAIDDVRIYSGVLTDDEVAALAADIP
ncbi:MAG: LamG domain-containing protein [Acidimicrobiia bacterium]